MQDVSKNKLRKPKENNKPLVEAKHALVEIDDLKKFFTTPLFINENKLLQEYNELEKLEKRSKEQDDKKGDLGVKLALLHGLDNGILLQTIINDPNHGQGLIKVRQNLIDEYKCQTASELMLVDRIITAYWQGMRYTMCLNWTIEKEPGTISFNESMIKILKELHKGIELANRQFETGLALLQNLKQPRLNVKVTADNAYVTQNQQIINTEEINSILRENH